MEAQTIKFYRKHQFYKNHLKFTAFVIGSFGPVFFLGTMLETAEPARWTLDLLKWPLDGAESYQYPTIRFLSALTGGFLFGWGMTVWFLSTYVYDKAPNEVRIAVILGLLSWFTLDSAGSVASETSSNVVFNLIILIMAVGPMWRKASE